MDFSPATPTTFAVRHPAAGRINWPLALPTLLLLILSAPATAQNPPRDSLQITEPARIIRDTVMTLASVRSGPRNALLWSIIPGGGQAYNKKFWKVPLVYGGFLGMIAYADFSQTRYGRLVTALEARCFGDGNVIVIPNAACIPRDDTFTGFPDQALIQERDNQDRARQTAYIGIFIVYLLQTVEAYTDAHLQEFDISDDLSVRLGPVAQPEYALGYGLTVPLGANRSLARQRARVRQLAVGK
ncbi:DUF5683 domain-containing protein [Neolewinella antarctica]|uniref:DUF5683 domain-containing protein n=1 Tax=Neolewinella antarctica TaxID=442734 RepID=A0ABX0X656_9BACT|nr:DUF5683 domain-containing protein [Neolewinella antarctica]NJC24686.1 hypothetical protein [Neolewinella antarctica]